MKIRSIIAYDSHGREFGRVDGDWSVDRGMPHLRATVPCGHSAVYGYTAFLDGAGREVHRPTELNDGITCLTRGSGIRLSLGVPKADPREWSESLRRKVNASKERERLQVLVDLQDEP